MTTPRQHASTGGASSTGIVAALSAYVLWGALTLYWKLLTAFDPVELVGWRIASAALVMAATITVTRRWDAIRHTVGDRRLLGRVVAASVMLAANWTTYVWAVANDHVVDTALGYFLAPLATMSIGVLVYHETLRAAQRVAVALATGAVVLMTVAAGRFPVVAIVLAGSWSIYGWTKKRTELAPLESMAAESFVLALPALVLVAARITTPGSVLDRADAPHLALVLGTGVITVVPLVLFARAAHRVPLTVLGPMQYLVPSINFLLGWLVFDERLETVRVIGFALVWAGLGLMAVDAVRRAQRVSASDDPPDSHRTPRRERSALR